MSGAPDIRRIGTMAPLELQLRRVKTRAAFLVLEMEKLLELVDGGERLSEREAHEVAEPLERVGELVVRIVRRHDGS